MTGREGGGRGGAEVYSIFFSAIPARSYSLSNCYFIRRDRKYLPNLAAYKDSTQSNAPYPGANYQRRAVHDIMNRSRASFSLSRGVSFFFVFFFFDSRLGIFTRGHARRDGRTLRPFPAIRLTIFQQLTRHVTEGLTLLSLFFFLLFRCFVENAFRTTVSTGLRLSLSKRSGER